MSKDFPLLAIDYGEKHTGLAWSPDGVVSFPLSVIQTQTALEDIQSIIETKKIQQLVVGLPMMDNGRKTPLTQTIQDVFQSDAFSIPIDFINERGSTKTALKSVNQGRADDVAAQQILSYYLDKKC